MRLVLLLADAGAAALLWLLPLAVERQLVRPDGTVPARPAPAGPLERLTY